MSRAWIQTNQEAWNNLAKSHYERFSQGFKDNTLRLNPLLLPHLHDIQGKKVLHLQCNTGRDSILLSRLGAVVTGVDFAPDNIYYAQKLALECGEDVRFIQGDVTRLWEVLDETFDIIITFDGVLGWLMDLSPWAKGLSHCIKDSGRILVLDTHPIYYIFDEEGLDQGELLVKYPYFKFDVEVNHDIGGYAGEPVHSLNGFKPITMSELINACFEHNLVITHMQEYDQCDPGMGGDTLTDEGLMIHQHFKDAFPIMMFCEIRPLKALMD